MNATTHGESARAVREAKDAVVSRPRGSQGPAIDDALRRYLGAETYEEQLKHDSDSDDGQAASGAASRKGRVPRGR
jgi:hypothetical protein